MDQVKDGNQELGTVASPLKMGASGPTRYQFKYPFPSYVSQKPTTVTALKIKTVTVHAHPDPAFDDAEWIASDKFQGGFLFPEDEKFGPIAMDAQWYRRHNPKGGGYYVEYEPGCSTFIHADAFEDAFTTPTEPAEKVERVPDERSGPDVVRRSRKVVSEAPLAGLMSAKDRFQIFVVADDYNSAREAMNRLFESEDERRKWMG